MLQELLCRLPGTLNKPNQILKPQNVSWVEEGSCSERLLGLNPRVSETAGLGKMETCISDRFPYDGDAAYLGTKLRTTDLN